MTSGTTSTRLVFFLTSHSDTHIYTLSLHDALPISNVWLCDSGIEANTIDNHDGAIWLEGTQLIGHIRRSEEHTSELQSRGQMVCRHLLVKHSIVTISAEFHHTNTAVMMMGLGKCGG